MAQEESSSTQMHGSESSLEDDSSQSGTSEQDAHQLSALAEAIGSALPETYQLTPPVNGWPGHDEEPRVPISRLLPPNVLNQVQSAILTRISHLQTSGALRPLRPGLRYMVDEDLRIYFRGMPSPERWQLMTLGAREAAQQSWLLPLHANVINSTRSTRITEARLDQLIATMAARPHNSHFAFGRAQGQLEKLRAEAPSERWELARVRTMIKLAYDLFDGDMTGISKYLDEMGPESTLSRGAPLLCWYPQTVSKLCGVEPCYDDYSWEWDDSLRAIMMTHSPRQARVVEENLNRYARAIIPGASASLGERLGNSLRRFKREMERSIPGQLRTFLHELSNHV